MKKSLAEIANWLGEDVSLENNPLVSGVSINTRTLQPGDLFIPFRGENVNGHRFVQDAFDKGAAASLWLKDEPNPPKDVPLLFVESGEKALQQMAEAYREELNATFIGITGSNGKTSTKDLVAGILSPYFRVKKTEGNFNNELGLPLTILALEEDTEFAVLEMGMSSFGEIEFLSKLAKPKYVVITNIGEAHMQDLGSREGIAKAKFEIIAGLQEDGKLFYDGDEPLLRPFIENTPSLHSISFGKEEANDLRIVEVTFTEQGSKFRTDGLINEEMSIPILGEHQVKNTLAALLIAKEVGLTSEQMRIALKEIVLTDMRMQVIEAVNGAIFINDAYNAAPTSMKAAISFVEKSTIKSDKWLVLGDMLELGENEKQYHEEMSAYISDKEFTGVCLFGPRMEWLYKKLLGKFNNEQLICVENEYEQIISFLNQRINADSIVLVKGSRGMKLEQIIEPFQK
ncbi:UDP-N-acetylmuramoyl-tripeptide--D-alanyl-D-alanine ligase [Psychrobacillus lasiicapitis]|uniref:UDP-N-acetylmuramoyl-tripeptide--D-alanyl-D-alanine ligase n=1 Tax=Psychrobacillus lasiicapitis TaxID=1636719 RepID=A0A544T5I0_9BACI|nr:UDP-N-acetylmuramoyl-tripeptide--D-alanyl-D-alanine ligase [Psychrobacillus lasiicapitis]TQR12666.1 UDP-N-acetylmuramoyl-tripeptide--D-alanyl-D-alanine ligase [Psychrobacillus lasiicapitis]GGA39964.1 UDP-N-acetylmuramoyl-tripeptide--D-alanyl-D-alanine ligase [Psychrobacillus lasiicapitis]